MQDLDRDAPEELTIGEYRRESLGDLQRAMCGLFSEPSLSLQDFGGIRAGSFRFSKGDVNDFHYKNLSGGEKAAFDILLDVFVKRDEAKEAVFCIDEPELHVATGLQGPLIASVLALLGRRRSCGSRRILSVSSGKHTGYCWTGLGKSRFWTFRAVTSMARSP